MNMYQWVNDVIKAPVKKALPVLSFPSIQLMDITVKELISDSDKQAEGMRLTAERCDTAASVSLMDLSLEAECFGSVIRFSEGEVPTVIGSIISTEEDAEALQIPEIGAGRTQIYIDAMEKAVKTITDRPVMAGVIGPFSLAGRLMDVTEAMVYCYEEPDMVHTVLDKVTTFLIQYINAYKAIGAHGVVLAEPLAGLLSPALADEFSCAYVKRIIDAVQTEEFLVVYHNCGNATIQQIDHILAMGSKMLHFGNAINIAEMLKHVPADIAVMGNVEPAGQFRNGTPESVREETKSLLEQCGSYPNFVISSGCDIPPLSPWANIDAFFETVKDFYKK